MAKRHAARRAVLVQALEHFEHPRRVLGEFLEAGLFASRDTVIEQTSGGGDRNTDPLAVSGLAVILGRLGPAAILAAEIVGDVLDVGDLVAEQMRQGIETPDHVEALPGIGGDRRLGLQIVIGLVGDVDGDAGGLLEGIDDLHEGDVFSLDEALPAQKVDLGAGFRLPLRGLCPRLGVAQQLIGRHRCRRGQRHGAALEQGTPVRGKIRHLWCSPSLIGSFAEPIVYFLNNYSRLPVSLWNRCAALGRGRRWIFSPGCTARRSRKIAMMSWVPIRATIWVSEPVGSTTSTSASIPSSANSRCSGRMP